MTMRWFGRRCRDIDDRDLHDRRRQTRKGKQIREPALLLRLSQRHEIRVVLARITVTSNLHPAQVPRVPPQQYLAPRGRDDERGGGQMKWRRAVERPDGLRDARDLDELCALCWVPRIEARERLG